MGMICKKENENEFLERAAGIIKNSNPDLKNVELENIKECLEGNTIKSLHEKYGNSMTFLEKASKKFHDAETTEEVKETAEEIAD
ncbi:MAG: hypothetical protein ACI4PR_05020 [Acutalibacteraceae bacterium]